MLATLSAIVLAAVLQPSRALAPGDRAPDLNGTTLEGKTVTGVWAKGDATVVIFFASWCQPCHRALRELAAIRRTVGPRARFLLIDVGDDPAKVQEFLAENPTPDGALVINDLSGIDKQRWGCQIFPTLFIVDRAAVVRYINHGWGDGSQAKYLHRLQNVLRGP